MNDRSYHPRPLQSWATGVLSTIVLVLAATALAPPARAQGSPSGCEMCGEWVTPCRAAPPVCPRKPADTTSPASAAQAQPADKCSETGAPRDCYHGVAYAGVYIAVVIYVLIGGRPAGHLDPHGSIGWNGSMTR